MKNLRADFPILQKKINDYPLVYLDSASASQKPQHVVDALVRFYTNDNANVGRGLYFLAEKATQEYEYARSKVAHFIGVRSEEIVFTSGTTASINFIATGWGFEHIQKGDEILLTEMEHHSNLVPWQQIAQKKGAVLKFIPVKQNGVLDLEYLLHLITNKTKLVSVVYTSNALGITNNVDAIIQAAHAVGAKVFLDAPQTVPHKKIDVTTLNCDFLAFSSQKMLGPTGLGILYIKKELQDEVLPYQFGGGMVFSVDWHTAIFTKAPYKFEAGSPPIAQVIGLGAAINYLNNNVDFDELQKHEATLCAQLIDGLQKIRGITILGPMEELKKSGHIVSFVVDGVHAHDVAAYLNQYGICVRAGHHCTQPLHKKLGITASVRVSFYLYNTPQEVDFLLAKLSDLVSLFS
ncbi:SufS family cysteine desulfurase [Candidatus Dependentiae bacterium]|nr:SufS family cysteine desulfurase [Candidatus Dependentiae bacterium]